MDQMTMQIVMNAPDPAVILTASPLVIGLVEVAKRSGLPARFAPMASLVLALPVMALLVDDPTSTQAFLAAMASGLAASGLYSGIRESVKAPTPTTTTTEEPGDA